jgi:hypothetical protein
MFSHWREREREPFEKSGVARHIGRLELLEAGLHIVGVVVVVGWKGASL